MSVKEAPFGEERVLEAIADGTFHGPAELRPGHQQGVYVDPVRVEREAPTGVAFVVYCHQYQVNIGFVPNRVVRKAAAQDRGQDRVIAPYLADQRLERGVEPLMRRS